MIPHLLGLALAFAPSAWAAVVAAPRLASTLAGAGAAPSIGAAHPPSAPSGAFQTSPMFSHPFALPTIPALPVPLALPAAPVLAGPLPINLAASAAPPAGSAMAVQSPDQDAGARALFDGGRPAAPGAAWTLGAFEGDGGAPIHYKTRRGADDAPARVYMGGLALVESFETFFARAQRPAGNELFLWTRGHAPSAWIATRNPLDADARDLARAIAIAADSAPQGKVELVLHSFGALVFQRMIQLHAEPAVAAALKAVAGSRVFMLQATTHFKGIEKTLGAEFERIVKATRMVADWLNAGDATASAWEAAARMNPFYAPAISAWLGQWRAQREQVISYAARDAVKMMRADLQEPWDRAVDRIRLAFLKALEANARDPGWQEALIRRSHDAFSIDFSPSDVARMQTLGLSLELAHSAGDTLLSWESARLLFERLGIDAPQAAPASGTILRDKSGRFRARIVAGDHYFPLKRRDDLAALLDP